MATIAARTDGKVAQYQLAGTTTTTTIGPYDSGTILGTVPPGKPGIKQIDGTVQNATDLTVTPVGNDSQNFLACTSQPQASGDPTVNSAQLASAGLSLAPQTE
jgi:hypothetical protein